MDFFEEIGGHSKRRPLYSRFSSKRNMFLNGLLGKDTLYRERSGS